MKVIDIEGDKISLTAEALSVPQFYVLWERDRGKFKKKAIKELTYVTFLIDNTTSNPYRGYGEDLRKEQLIKDFFEEGWEPDAEVIEAVEKMRSLQKTTSSRLVSSAKQAADKLADYYSSVDFTKYSVDGKPLYSAKDVQGNIKDLFSTIKSLFALEEQLRKEQMDGNTARGGFEIGEFEIPSTDINYGD